MNPNIWLTPFQSIGVFSTWQAAHMLALKKSANYKKQFYLQMPATTRSVMKRYNPVQTPARP